MRRVLQILALFGLDPARLWQTLRGLPGFALEALHYRRLSTGSRFPLRVAGLRPLLGDRAAAAGVAFGHYFHQDLWAARLIHAAKPASHVDVGSRLDGFVSHLLVFLPLVRVIDIRPLESRVAGLEFVRADATDLAWVEDDSVLSLSSLHAVEHFGLGRYGDKIDPEAPFRAMRALARVLAPGGRLYFSVPVGQERLEFNAQRVFAPRTVIEGFRGLDLLSFGVVTDDDRLVEAADPDELGRARYACGLFVFTKPAAAR